MPSLKTPESFVRPCETCGLPVYPGQQTVNRYRSKQRKLCPSCLKASLVARGAASTGRPHVPHGLRLVEGPPVSPRAVEESGDPRDRRGPQILMPNDIPLESEWDENLWSER